MTSELQRAVGRNLRRVREELGLSQATFAERLGCHRTYSSGIERGERNLSLQSLEKIASLLQVDPRELLRDLPSRPARITPATVPADPSAGLQRAAPATGG